MPASPQSTHDRHGATALTGTLCEDIARVIGQGVRIAQKAVGVELLATIDAHPFRRVSRRHSALAQMCQHR